MKVNIFDLPTIPIHIGNIDSSCKPNMPKFFYKVFLSFSHLVSLYKGIYISFCKEDIEIELIRQRDRKLQYYYNDPGFTRKL